MSREDAMSGLIIDYVILIALAGIGVMMGVACALRSLAEKVALRLVGQRRPR